MKIYSNNRNCNFLLLFIFIGNSIITNAQSKTNILQDLSIEVQYSLEKQDKRLFEFPQKEMLLIAQPEKWGTHQYGINFLYGVINRSKIRMQVGLGYTKKISTFRRPFDHSSVWLESPTFERVIRYTDRYELNMIQVPHYFNFYLSDKVAITLGNRFQFDFNRNIHPTNEIPTFRTETVFRFYSIETIGGIRCRLKRLRLSVDTRILNIKKNDRLIFYNLLFRSTLPPENQIEFYNPLRITFSMGYNF